MRCPKCLSIHNKVIDSRVGKNQSSIRRRRECSDCGYRFSTMEAVLHEDVVVVKRDGRREEFDRGKIQSGIRRAIEKRPVDIEQVDLLISDVIKSLDNEFDVEIPSAAIGEAIMERLKKIDKVAYVRYASIYKDFRDISDFANEITKLGTESA
jgi:transcriptional repressor NrdR